MADIKPLIAGNWKMNGITASLAEVERLREGAAARELSGAVDIMVCPPATLIAAALGLLRNTPITVGAQDCHVKPSGAFTGDLSAPMLADAGARAVIVGHSERRAMHGERDQDVREKAQAVHGAGLQAIICVGETAGERRLGLTLAVIGRQLQGSLPEGATAANCVIAYEPVWAIGTGLTPTAADIAEVHHFIRAELTRLSGSAMAGTTRILYGGSVKPDNAGELLAIAGVNGALVGGASLKADDFLGIIAAVAGLSA